MLFFSPVMGSFKFFFEFRKCLNFERREKNNAPLTLQPCCVKKTKNLTKFAIIMQYYLMEKLRFNFFSFFIFQAFSKWSLFSVLFLLLFVLNFILLLITLCSRKTACKSSKC